jgi:hypothetical protein
MKSGNLILICGVLSVLLFSGCTKMIAVGELDTYCDEHCPQNKDAGVCAPPYDIFQNRAEYARRSALENKGCGGC